MDIDHIYDEEYMEETEGYDEEYEGEREEEGEGYDEEDGEYTISNVELNAVFTPLQKYRFVNKLCLTCGKDGHFAAKCPLKKTTSPQNRSFGKPRFTRRPSKPIRRQNPQNINV